MRPVARASRPWAAISLDLTGRASVPRWAAASTARWSSTFASSFLFSIWSMELMVWRARTSGSAIPSFSYPSTAVFK